MREIRVIVNKDGTTSTDFSGFQGPSCLDEAERLRQLLAELGVQSEQTDFVPKPELGSSVQHVTGQRQTHEHTGG